MCVCFGLVVFDIVFYVFDCCVCVCVFVTPAFFSLTLYTNIYLVVPFFLSSSSSKPSFSMDSYILYSASFSLLDIA